MSKKKTMYTLEFTVRCSPVILYDFLSTPVGLQEWFADKVQQRDHVFYFTWNGSTDSATVLEQVESEFIRYRWEHQGKDEFFEFSIDTSPVTGETILRITDFADKNEMKDQQQLWNSQISELKHRLGS